MVRGAVWHTSFHKKSKGGVLRKVKGGLRKINGGRRKVKGELREVKGGLQKNPKGVHFLSSLEWTFLAVCVCISQSVQYVRFLCDIIVI